MTDSSEAIEKTESPAKPRIGDGQLLIIFGIVLLCLAGFCAMAGAGGGEGAGALGALFGSIAAALFGTAFIKRMFHLIERRLIDLQEDIRRAP